MLMGLATKNSIILIDYINHLMGEGKGVKDAIIEAGRTRLRPILMTSVALIAGMIPIAIGLNEVSNQRTSLGAAVIGGVISSTLFDIDRDPGGIRLHGKRTSVLTALWSKDRHARAGRALLGRRQSTPSSDRCNRQGF
jgi:hypothetical protein